MQARAKLQGPKRVILTKFISTDTMTFYCSEIRLSIYDSIILNSIKLISKGVFHITMGHNLFVNSFTQTAKRRREYNKWCLSQYIIQSLNYFIHQEIFDARKKVFLLEFWRFWNFWWIGRVKAHWLVRDEETRWSWKADDPNYYKYHRLVSHRLEKFFVCKDRVMQLVNEKKIVLHDDKASSNKLSTTFGSHDPVQIYISKNHEE